MTDTEGRGLKPIGLKAYPTEHESWKAAADRAGVPFTTWARALLNAAATGDGSPAAVADAELQAALEQLRAVYFVREPRDVVRMAVLAAARRMRAGQDPFRVPEGPPAVVTIPAPPPRKR